VLLYQIKIPIIPEKNDEPERDKRSDKSLIVKSKNCDDQRLLVPKINPVFFVNILSGGVFGSTTDYATDSMWKYDENVHLDCKK